MNNSKEEIIKVMRASFITKGVPLYMRKEITKAHFDRHWDFYTQSDGLTWFKDSTWINMFPPVFVWHDWRMQNRESLRGSLDLELYVKNTNIMLKKMMEVYRYSWVKRNTYPILAQYIGWKLFKR